MQTLFPIIGQQKILEMLHRIADRRRYANAYLFHGPDGTGKEALAMEFAALMNCQNEGERPCGTCVGCKQMKHLQHPNLHLLFALPGGSSDKGDPLKGLGAPVIEEIHQAIYDKSQNPYRKLRISKAQNIKISSVRAMQKDIHFGLAEKGRKVILIYEAERMNKSAFNSILKVVEEPPENTSFIFCTSALHQIPETIQSRCQLVPFRLLSQEDISQGLEFRTDLDDETIHALSRMAFGNFRFALSLAEEGLEPKKEQVVRFLQSVMGGRALPIREQVVELEAMYNEEPARLKQMLSLIQLWFRDAHLWSETEDQHRLTFRNMGDKIQRFVEYFPDADYVRVRHLLENAVDFIERNVYIRLALYSLLIQLHQAIQAKGTTKTKW